MIDLKSNLVPFAKLASEESLLELPMVSHIYQVFLLEEGPGVAVDHHLVHDEAHHLYCSMASDTYLDCQTVKAL